MAKETKNAACRFCGQQHIIENGGDMTEPQLEECATMRCTCDDAKLYQETANRRGTAKQRAQELFGENAGEYKQSEEIMELINNAIDLVCDKELKQVTVTIRTGLNCRIMQMAKDKIKIVRETSNAEAFEQQEMKMAVKRSFNATDTKARSCLKCGRPLDLEILKDNTIITCKCSQKKHSG